MKTIFVVTVETGGEAVFLYAAETKEVALELKNSYVVKHPGTHLLINEENIIKTI